MSGDLREDYVIVDTGHISDVIGAALAAVRDPMAVSMMLAIAFEYSLLMAEMPPEAVEKMRAVTMAEAKDQARHFFAVVQKAAKDRATGKVPEERKPS